MLASNRLRIDPCDGSPVAEYRIENDLVESRTLETEAAERSTPTTDQRWHRVTPEQLSSHVMADTALAQWLLGRMGVYSLIRACNSSTNIAVHSERIAA